LKVRDFTCFRDPAEDLVRGTVQCVLSNRVHAYHQIDSWDVLVIGTKEGTFVALRKPVDQVGKSNCVLTPQHLSDNNCGLLSSNLDKFFLYTIFDVTSTI